MSTIAIIWLSFPRLLYWLVQEYEDEQPLRNAIHILLLFLSVVFGLTYIACWSMGEPSPTSFGWVASLSTTICITSLIATYWLNSVRNQLIELSDSEWQQLLTLIPSDVMITNNTQPHGEKFLFKCPCTKKYITLATVLYDLQYGTTLTQRLSVGKSKQNYVRDILNQSRLM